MKKGKFAIILLIVAAISLCDLHYNPVDIPMEELKTQVNEFLAHKEKWLDYYLHFAEKMEDFTEALLKNFGLEIETYEKTTQNTTNTTDNTVNEMLDILNSEEILDAKEQFTEYIKDDENLDEVSLVRIVDGDTIIVNDGLADIKVRMIGIDTPESVHQDEEKNNIYGSMASDYTKSLLGNASSLYLQYDEEKEDNYGRTLAYVWLSSDVDVTKNDDISNYMVNAILLKDGYAYSKAYSPNDAYADIFQYLCDEAATNNNGLWIYEEYKDLWE